MAAERALHQPFVQTGKHARGVGAAFVNPAQRSHHQRAIHRRREALAYHVAQVNADETVRQLEKVGKIPAYLEKRYATEGDLQRFVAESLNGQQ